MDYFTYFYHRLKGRVFEERELPAYFVAQSRCFRPEVSSGPVDSGLYRVHGFNKVGKKTNIFLNNFF